MSFTPGPWTVDETKALGVYGVWTDYATHPGYDGAGYASQICSFNIDHSITPEERKSNAKLIAAAPLAVELAQQIMFSKDYSLIRKMAAEFLEKAGVS